MTQTPRGATRRNYFALGTQVQIEGQPEQTGTVVASDDFYDTLKLRGIADNQVLVEWPRNGHPTRTWQIPADLVILKGQTAEIPVVTP